MKNFLLKRKWLLIPLVLILGALGFYLFNQFKPKEIKAYNVKHRNIVATLTVTGEVEADTTVEISTPVQAEIVELFVDEGDQVKAGQPLARLNQKETQGAVSEALGRVAQAQGALTFLTQGTRPEEIGRLKAQVAQTEAALSAAQASAQEASQNVTRMTSLYKEKVISAQEYDQFVTQAETATQEVHRLKASRTAAENQLRQAVTGPTQAEIEEARGNLKAAQGALTAANARQADRLLTSSTAGIITKRLREPGDLAIPGTPIFRVANPATLQIKALVEESDLSRVSLGDDTYTTLDALPETPLHGTVTRIGSEVNPDNGTVEVIIHLDSQPSNVQAHNTVEASNPLPKNFQLLPGMTADVNFITDRLKQALVIPATAVEIKDGKNYVYRFEGTRLIRRAVEAYRLSTEALEITGGLSPNDWIAGYASDTLQAETWVKPVDDPQLEETLSRGTRQYTKQ